MAYNFDRPYEVREKRCDELERKACLRADARFVVLRGHEARYGNGCIQPESNCSHQVFFDNLRTARAFAQHASDCYDAPFGIYRYEFIEGVDTR